MLTFPPNTLTAQSVAFPIVFRDRGIVGLNKDSGIPIDEHPWNAGAATLCGELRKRIAQEQPSALALGIERPAAICLTDSACSGVVLLADRESGVLDFWRNAVGSEQLKFRFVFLAKPRIKSDEESFVCRLPVAAHFTDARALISNKTGKKSQTNFSLIEKFSGYELWAAETTFPRLHQVRLHAVECGLPVVGDSVYGGVPAIENSKFGKKGRLNKGEARPIYMPPCIHLEKVFLPDGSTSGGNGAVVEAELPAGFSALLKKLRTLR